MRFLGLRKIIARPKGLKENQINLDFSFAFESAARDFESIMAL